MPDDFFYMLGFISFSVLILSWLTEVVLAATWNKAYFTHGLPLFLKKIPMYNHQGKIPPKRIFQTHFHSMWSMSIVFKKIGPNAYGFREHMFQITVMKYSPVMHGLLIFDDVNHQVIVKGFANWFANLFMLIFFLMGFVVVFKSVSILAAIFISVFLIFLIGFPYAIQYSRFSEIADVAVEAWSIESGTITSTANSSTIDRLHTGKRNWVKGETKIE